jgi:hypothetical protein
MALDRTVGIGAFEEGLRWWHEDRARWCRCWSTWRQPTAPRGVHPGGHRARGRSPAASRGGWGRRRDRRHRLDPGALDGEDPPLLPTERAWTSGMTCRCRRNAASRRPAGPSSTGCADSRIEACCMRTRPDAPSTRPPRAARARDAAGSGRSNGSPPPGEIVALHGGQGLQGQVPERGRRRGGPSLTRQGPAARRRPDGAGGFLADASRGHRR